MEEDASIEPNTFLDELDIIDFRDDLRYK